MLAASAAQAQSDRYGPDQTANQRVATLDGRYLSWPGKQAPADATAQLPLPAEQPAPQPEPPAPQPQPQPDEATAAPAVASLPAVLPTTQPPAPPPQPVAVVQPAPQPAARPAPPPLAGASAAHGAPQQTAEDAGHARLPPHIYSVAREYGLRPDPIPLPSQFFADPSAPDLAAPPSALPPRPVPGAQTVNNPSSINTPSNRARAIAQDTPSPDDSSDSGN